MAKNKKFNTKNIELGDFSFRHIGLNLKSKKEMLKTLGYSKTSSFIKAIIPKNILSHSLPNISEKVSERKALEELRKIASKNMLFHSLIGQGYYNTFTPPVILRNVLENPSWYTSYTPYQSEISQGRLEALINYQTVISDLTGLEISNASLLDEATAAAEAMTLARRISKLNGLRT